MAILKKRNIEICGSDDGVHCIDDWNRYWIIRDAVSQNVLRRIQLEPIRHLSVTWHGNFKDRDGIYFNELGETGGQQGRFNLDLGVGHKEIVITLSGRMR
jgi:hypothetical protein